MKKIIEYIGITIFFVISLFYVDKITNIIKNKDPIMKTIVSKMDKYNIDSVDAIIMGDVIIPGVRGKIVNINASYEEMKKINEYTDKLLKYRDVIPEITINNIYNKYIVSGNKYKREVSIVVNINNSIDEIIKISKSNKVKLNVFIDSTLLDNEYKHIDNEYIHLYNGGTFNNYDDITIEWMNDVITDNYNQSKYCINKNKNDDNLLLCARNRMHTISPKIVINSANLLTYKSNIENGSIIYFDEIQISHIKSIVNYLKIKGYEIVYLNELLDENV